MVIYQENFEDKIAVIYELIQHINRDGIIEYEKVPQKIRKLGFYRLDNTKDYIIICAKSEYKVNQGKLERTFISNN